MKNTSFIVIIIFVLFTNACQNKKNEYFTLSPNSHSTRYEKLIVDILCNGNVESYQTLLCEYSDSFRIEEMLAYSLIMANKYDYSQAYFDVFDILTSIPNHNAQICVQSECLDEGFYCLDENTKIMALEYFKQAIYKGDKMASNKLINTYNKNKTHPIVELYSDKKLIQKAIENLDKVNRN